MSTIGKMGETAWIEKAARWCGTGAARVGIGDDAAVLPAGRARDLLVTTDMLLEGVHFRLAGTRAYDIGWKAMAVNLSDIAAMGGLPRAAVVSLGVPADARLPFLREFYRGLNRAARRFGAAVVGGDTNRSARWVIAVTVIGETEKGRAVRRSGARAGDWLFVSGRLGNSLRSGRHLRFVPRIREARWLCANFRVHAMMDLSDGLASDVRRIASQSGVGIRLDEDRIPVSAGAVSVRQALTDGEDFELLFSLSPADGKRLLVRTRPKGFPVFTRVGTVTPRPQGIRLRKRDGRTVPLTLHGFDHFL